jgi:hypothetical protein
VLADRARVALRAAAERAMTLHANAAAVDWFEQALAVTSDPAERAAILLRMSEPAEASRGFLEGMRYLRGAIAWYEAQGDVATTDEALIRLVRSHIMAFDPREARQLIAPVVERLAAGPDTVTGAAAYNEYARTFLFTSDYVEGLHQLEPGLVIAERLGALVTIAELLVTKAWALAGLGRLREGAALAMGGLELAEQTDSTSTILRARMNASNWYCEEDPRQALDIASGGIELAQRIGHGDWAAGLSSNASQAALLTGDWDRILSLREELDGEHLSAVSRYPLHAWSWVVEAYRGVDVTESMEGPVALARTDGTTQTQGLLPAISAYVRFASGDLEGVAESALEAYRRYPELEGQAALLVAARAAILLRDRGGIRAILEVMPFGSRPGGRWLTTRLALIQAAQDRLEGRGTDVASAYAAAIRTFRTMGLTVEIAFTELELVALEGDTLPDREALCDEAVGILRGLGVRPLLERLASLDLLRESVAPGV